QRIESRVVVERTPLPRHTVEDHRPFRFAGNDEESVGPGRQRMACDLELTVAGEAGRLVRARAPDAPVGNQGAPYLALLARGPPVGDGDLGSADRLQDGGARAGARELVAGLAVHRAAGQEVG